MEKSSYTAKRNSSAGRGGGIRGDSVAFKQVINPQWEMGAYTCHGSGPPPSWCFLRTLAKKRKHWAGCILAVFFQVSVMSWVICGFGEQALEKSLERREIAGLKCLWPRFCVQMGPDHSKPTSLHGTGYTENRQGRSSLTVELGMGWLKTQGHAFS